MTGKRQRNPEAGRRRHGTAPDAGRLGRFGWAMFDWSNQPFFTLVTTFIFAPYFATTVVSDAVLGQAQWGYAQSLAGLAIAVFGPILGAVADAHGPRKPWIGGFQAVLVLACTGLWWAVPGAPLWPILALVVLATLGAEFSTIFNNAMLPGLVPGPEIGRLSGRAWGLGYVGGLLALFVVLFGFSLPEAPWFGLDKVAHEHDRMVGPLSGLWVVVFVAPLFLFTPDERPSGRGLGRAVGEGLRRLLATLRQARAQANFWRFLVARMLYQDGLTAIFAFGGIYAAGAFEWTTVTLGVFGIILLVFAALGAILGGWLDDWLGSKRVIQIALAGILLATLGVVSISTAPLADGMARHTIFFVLTEEVEIAPDAPPDAGFFPTLAERVCLAFGILLGFFGGPLQAASRTMVARLAPGEMITEFYGLFALSGRATAFLAPFLIATLTAAFESQRAGIAVLPLFLVAGFLLLLPVEERRG